MQYKLTDKQHWYSWFAWHPVTVGDKLVWLESVERRWIPDLGWSIDGSGYSFATGGWEYK